MEYLETEWLDQEGLGLEPQCPLWSDALCTPTSSLSSTPEAPASQPHFLLLQRFWPERSPGSFRRKRFCVTPSPAQQRWGLPAHRGRAPSFHHSPCALQASHDQMSDPRSRGEAGRASSYCRGGPGPPHTAPPSQEPHTSLTALHPLKLELPPGLTQHCCQPSHYPFILHPSFHLSTHPPTHPFTCISILHLLIHPSIHSTTSLSFYPSIPIH